MLLKSIRFYLNLLTDAGLNFSPHFASRRKPRPSRSGNTKRTKKSTGESDTGLPSRTDRVKAKSSRQDDEAAKDGETVTYPMFFKGKAEGRIVVPRGMAKDDCKVLELTVALVKAYAEQE